MNEVKNRITKTELIGWKNIKYFLPEKLHKITKPNLEKLKKSLVDTGFLLNFTVFDKNNELHFLDGYIRKKAMDELLNDGCKIPEILPANFITIKDDKEAKEIYLLLKSQYANFNKDEFLAFFEDLEFELSNIDLPNFDLALARTKEIIEDEIPELDNELKSKRGDLWLLGPHKLLCGDSTNPKDVEYLMDGKKGHLLFTDPPYNVNYAEFNKTARDRGKDWTDAYCSEWKDSMSDDDYYTFCKNFIQNAKNNLVLDAHMYIFYAMVYHHTFVKIFDELKIKYDKIPMVWKKQTLPISWARYKRIYEPFFFCDSKKRWFGPNNEKNIWEVDCESNNKYIHPTQKPVKLPARAIQNSSKKGEIVLELFGGSGSTMMACEQTGRICRSIEYEPVFADGIVKRYKNFKESSEGIYLIREGKQYGFDEVFKK